MRILGFLLLLTSSLFADVLVLKGGAKVPGRVVDKPDHYEVTSEGVPGITPAKSSVTAIAAPDARAPAIADGQTRAHPPRGRASPESGALAVSAMVLGPEIVVRVMDRQGIGRT